MGWRYVDRTVDINKMLTDCYAFIVFIPSVLSWTDVYTPNVQRLKLKNAQKKGKGDTVKLFNCR